MLLAKSHERLVNTMFACVHYLKLLTTQSLKQAYKLKVKEA